MASPPPTDFREHSENIVRSFLQTIVVVDDRAYFEKTESSVRPTALVSPARPSFTDKTNDAQQAESAEAQPATTSAISSPMPEPEIEQAKTAEETSEDLAHELNAKKLIENFADKGIVCAVLRPSEFELDQLDKKLFSLAERADVIVFDWVLFKDTEGKKVSELITEITKKSSEENSLRLILVYTGERRLSGIIDGLERVLKDSGITNVSRKDEFTVETRGTRITAYGKGNVDPGDDVLRSRMAPVDQLPDTVVAEFATRTSGLVSNVALASLAALRGNTHRILSTFDPEIDAPFMSHRVMLDPPEDATNFLVQLIGGELTAVLDGYQVGNVADAVPGLDILKAWVEKNEAEGYAYAQRFGAGPQGDAMDQVYTLLRKGASDNTLHAPFDVFKKDPHKKELTKKLASSPESASDLEHRFAILTTLRSNYRSEQNPPLLFPGTLVKETPQGAGEVTYWLCIQPICDCLRIEERRSFPFLRLLPPTEQSHAFNLVLPDDGRYVRLRVEYSPYKSRMIDFDPSPSLQAVVSQTQDASVYFTSTNGIRLKWIADLKFEHTQRVFNNYAAQLSRVGLDESEWLRRSSR